MTNSTLRTRLVILSVPFARASRRFSFVLGKLSCGARFPNASVAGRSGLHAQASVPIPKFAHPCGGLECELRNQRDTSNAMILVPLLNPKFANALAARRVRTSGSRH